MVGKRTQELPTDKYLLFFLGGVPFHNGWMDGVLFFCSDAGVLCKHFLACPHAWGCAFNARPPVRPYAWGCSIQCTTGG